MWNKKCAISGVPLCYIHDTTHHTLHATQFFNTVLQAKSLPKDQQKKPNKKQNVADSL